MSFRAVLRKFKVILEDIYYGLTIPKFYLLKVRASGMLSPRIYKNLYQAIYKLPDLDIVEIGGAAGAASIAIAWAMKDSGKKKSKLIVIEKLEGGSRSDYGLYEENLKIINHQFDRFNVQEQIILFPRKLTLENGQKVLSLISTGQLAAFIHDADGRLDRDFQLFWPLLIAGGLIVIDDYAEKYKFRPISEKFPSGGIKKLMTFRLVNQFIMWGLIKPDHILGNTVFGIKPRGADISKLDIPICEDIIQGVLRERETHFADI